MGFFKDVWNWGGGGEGWGQGILTMGGSMALNKIAGRDLARDPFGDVAAAEAQERAQQEALARQQAEVNQTRDYLGHSLSQGRKDVNDYAITAEKMMRDGNAAAMGNYDQAAQQMWHARNGQQSALDSGYEKAQHNLGRLAALQSYATDATRPVEAGSRTVNPYDVTGQSSRLESMLGRGEALAQRIGGQTNPMQDPGYQFRQQQGEQAIMRANAAQGGRAGGRAMKELANFNQGLASQEYGAAHQRQLAENSQLMSLLGQQYGAAGNVDQMRQAALFNQAGRTDAAGQQGIQNSLAAQLAAQQNQMALGQYGLNAQSQMGQLALQQGMQNADLHRQYGNDMANLYGQRAQTNLGLGSQLGQLYANTGQQLGSMNMSGAGYNTALTQSMMEAQANAANAAGMAAQASANSNKGILGAVASIVSDERIKTNVEDGDTAAEELLESIAPYTFEYADKSITEDRILGVMAQDLERSEIGRACVDEVNGVKMINAWKAVSALFGVVAHLHSEIEQLKAKVEG